jgi:hypothetical protein
MHSTATYILGIITGIFLSIQGYYIPKIRQNIKDRLASRAEAKRGYVEFQQSDDPPDQGIEQRIYQPRGTPANINRNAMRRPSRNLPE